MVSSDEEEQYDLHHPTKKLPLLISTVVVGLLGAFISFITNCTLAEISTNPYMCLYYGLLFIGIGCFVLYKAQQSWNNRVQLGIFGLAIVLSGFICFILEKDWVLGLSAHTKIVLYAILGVSITFSMVFTGVDILNWIVSFCDKRSTTQPGQLTLIFVASSVMGVIFGLTFGLMDIEDSASYELRMAVMREEVYCFPAGFIVGGICGFLNEKARQKDREFLTELDIQL